MKRDGGSAADAGRMILRGAQATAAGFGGRLAARLLFLFVAGRLFGPAPFGAYVLAVAAVELAVSVGSLGMKKIVFQLLDMAGAEGGGAGSARPLPHILLDSALLVLLAGLLLAAAMMASAWLLPAAWLPGGAARALFLLAPMVAGQSLLDLFLAATRWKHAIRWEVLARSIVEPYALLAGAAGAWALGFEAEGLLAGYWCGTLAALAYALFGARRTFGGFGLLVWRPERRVLASTLRAAGDNTATDLLNALYTRVDLWLVGLLLGVPAAGVYGMAKQIAVPIRQVRQSFDGLLIPLVARTLAARGSQGAGEALASATRLILAIQLPLLVALYAAGGTLLAWLGKGFAPAYWPALALAAAETVQAAFSIGDLVFVYLRPRLGLWLTLASIAIGAGAAFLLIPLWGIGGAALSVLAAYGARAVWRSLVLRGQFSLTVPHTHHAGPFVAAAAGIAAAAAARTLAPGSAGEAAALAAGLVAYGAALFLWLRLKRESLTLTGFTAEAPAG
jgi:O-antigen/teichoic acid export membrane protein